MDDNKDEASFSKEVNDEFIVQSKGLAQNQCFDASIDRLEGNILYKELKVQWDKAILGLTAVEDNKRLCDEWFDRIFHLHNEKQRHYHTPVHLQEILGYWNIIKRNNYNTTSCTTSSLLLVQDEQEHRSKAIVLATFFHDSVYDPKSSKNERDSAMLFHDFCKQVLDVDTTFSIDDTPVPLTFTSTSTTTTIKNKTETIARLVVVLILATEGHQLISEESMNSIDLETQKLFLDLDMAVLGKERDAYLAYAALIRREYEFVVRKIYCEKRAEVLTGFLQNKKRIFLSDLFYHAMEDRARLNLQHEIDLLRQNIIPGE